MNIFLFIELVECVFKNITFERNTAFYKKLKRIVIWANIDWLIDWLTDWLIGWLIDWIIYLFIYLFVSLFVYLFIYLFVCLFIYSFIYLALLDNNSWFRTLKGKDSYKTLPLLWKKNLYVSYGLSTAMLENQFFYRLMYEYCTELYKKLNKNSS